MYSDYSLIPTRYKKQCHEINDQNDNIKIQMEDYGLDALGDRKRILFYNKQTPI